MRAVSQRISYEVRMRTLLFCPLLFIRGFELSFFREFGFSFIILCLEVFVLWYIRVLAETNRAPFDFVEGESELVSGYNVEFGGFGFALIALAEYGNILFMSLLTCVVFISGLILWGVMGDFMLSVFVFFMSYRIIWVRGCFPRFRYDMLMAMCWKIILPLSLCMFLFYLFLGL